MARSLFSQSWHSVADLKPRLLPGARIHRHIYRGQVWFIVQDQAGGRYHRFTPAAHALIQRMDGSTTVQALWDEACERAPDEIPTQSEMVDLLIQLHAADLLQADITPDSAALFERYQKRRNQPWKQGLMNPMALKIPLLDPDAFLSAWAHRLRWMVSSVGALLWIAVVIPAIFVAAQHLGELTENLSDRVLSARNLMLMLLVFPFVKALHELGHGFVTKIWGGSVHEMGIMFLVFAPMPYVEASAASAFPSKYRRAVVGAAGMLVEIFLAAIALYVWILVEPGIVRAVAFNVMLVAGISTLVVNGNPLLRYDAYFILTDLIEMPNLAQRGQRHLSYLWDRYVFGARDIEPSAETPSERRWLVSYTILSWCYRVFITLSIILFIAGKFFVFGVLLALWGAFALFGMPIWKAVRHVLQSPVLHRRRVQAIRISLTLLTVGLVVMCIIPIPMRSQAEGVVWLPDQALLRAGGNGHFQRWLVQPGSLVTRGMPVLTLDDPALATEVAVARAKVDEAVARHRMDQFTDPMRAGIAKQQVEQEQRVLAHAEERYKKLVVRAEADGLLMAPTPQDMEGQFFKKGDLLGYVLDRTKFIARVVVPQDNIDLVRTNFRSVELRLVDAMSEIHSASIIREMPGGVNELPSAALGTIGGGSIAVDPNDDNGIRTLERIFVVDLQLPQDVAPEVFGERVHVRFNHAPEPLFSQGYRRVRQLFLSRFSV